MKRKLKCAISKTLRHCDKIGTNHVVQKWITGHIVSDKWYCDEHYQEQLERAGGEDNMEFQFKSPDLFHM